MAETAKQLKPNTIKVEVERSEELNADHADLFVVIKGASLVTGRAALSKAREVAQLVADLKTCALTDEAIHLEGVYAEVVSGILSKSSRATYKLKIRCAKLDDLADVLGAITSQKNTTLQNIQWGYADSAAARQQWLAACIDQANRKAGVIATALGVKLLGVLSFSERFLDPESPIQPVSGGEHLDRAAFSRARAVSQDDLGTEVSHAKTITLYVEIEYYISEFITQGEA